MIPKVAGAPVIDGELSDPAWKSAPALELGRLLKDQPGVPDNRTTVKMVTDDRNLYFAFWCAEKHPNGPHLMDPQSPFAVPWVGGKGNRFSIGDHVGVVISMGRFGSSEYFTLYGHPGGAWQRDYYSYISGDCMYRYFCNWRKPDSTKPLPSVLGKAKIARGSWTFEAKIGFDDLLPYPKRRIRSSAG